MNTASRMESHGVPGKIQIARGMKDLLEDDFVCAAGGAVEVKGIGETECRFPEDRLPSRPGRPPTTTDGGAKRQWSAA